MERRAKMSAELIGRRALGSVDSKGQILMECRVQESAELKEALAKGSAHTEGAHRQREQTYKGSTQTKGVHNPSKKVDI